MSTDPSVPDAFWRDPEFQQLTLREQRQAMRAYDKGAQDALRSLAESFERNGMTLAAESTRKALAVVDRTVVTVGWAHCPNDPPCGHGRVLHDGDGYDEPFTCCADGCRCGR